MIPASDLPQNDPAAALAWRCREFAQTAELIKSRLRDMQAGPVNWATANSASKCVMDLEQIAAFLSIDGFKYR